jgi:hypothetical protein
VSAGDWARPRAARRVSERFCARRKARKDTAAPSRTLFTRAAGSAAAGASVGIDRPSVARANGTYAGVASRTQI